jgi:hypothetical protein
MRVAAPTITLAVVAAEPVAYAEEQALRITVREFPSWPAAVAAMQAQVSAEGTVLHVGVTNRDGSPARCDQYRLALDRVGAAAFTIGACDVASGETAVALTQRTALFAHDDVIPEPLAAGIDAVEVLTGGASGGAVTTGGSALTCSVAVQPFVTDLEHGTRVMLTPGRYVLRPFGASVTVDAQTNGWMLSAMASGALAVEYEVYDTQRDRVVTHDRATLQCGAEALPPVTVSRAMPMARAIPQPEMPPRIPGAALAFTTDFASGAYLPLADVTFHRGANAATGRELQLLGAWLYAPTAGLAFDTRFFHAQMDLGVFLGDRIAGIAARATAALALQAGQFRAFAGVSYSLAAFWLSPSGVSDVRWNTDPLSSLGATASIGWRAAMRTQRGALRVTDMHVDATLPVVGSGAVMFGFGLSLGGGL